MELRKIRSWVSNHQGPILVLRYLWFTNTEHNRKKDNSGLLRNRGYIYSRTNSLNTNISISIFNDIQTLNKWKERQDKLIYTYRNIQYVHNTHTSNIIQEYKNTTQQIKYADIVLWTNSIQNEFKNEKKKLTWDWWSKPCGLYILLAQQEATSLLFKEQNQKIEHVFTLQKTKIKEFKMDSGIVTYHRRNTHYLRETKKINVSVNCSIEWNA